VRQASPAEIGRRLAHIRAGESQERHADALGVPLRTYQNYEQGKREPDLRTLLSLYLLGWNLNWLLSGDGPERLSIPETASQSGSQSLRHPNLKIALQLVAEALGPMRATPDQHAELVILVFELLEDGLPEARVLHFARRAVSAARGVDDGDGSAAGGASSTGSG
jgi:transcriptional regulator with XRE-family HTH domain